MRSQFNINLCLFIVVAMITLGGFIALAGHSITSINQSAYQYVYGQTGLGHYIW